MEDEINLIRLSKIVSLGIKHYSMEKKTGITKRFEL